MESKAGSYYWALFRIFGRECYRTWRQELFVSFISAVVVYGLTYKSDPAALESLKIALQSAGIVLSVFAAVHLIKAPYLAHMEFVSTQPNWLFGIVGVLALGVLAFGAYIVASKLLLRPSTQVARGQPESKAQKEENPSTKDGPVHHASKPQAERAKPTMPVPQPSALIRQNTLPNQNNPIPTQLDRISEINRRMSHADRERLAQSLFEFSKLLDQANELWGKVNLEGGTLSHSWGGELNDEANIQAHINNLRDLKELASDFRESFRNLQVKWRYYETQIDYVLGEGAENNGPNALMNALDDYLQYLESWKTVANKGGRNTMMYQDTQNTYDLYVRNFALWKQACETRLQQMRDSLQ